MHVRIYVYLRNMHARRGGRGQKRGGARPTAASAPEAAAAEKTRVDHTLPAEEKKRVVQESAPRASDSILFEFELPAGKDAGELFAANYAELAPPLAIVGPYPGSMNTALVLVDGKLCDSLAAEDKLGALLERNTCTSTGQEIRLEYAFLPRPNSKRNETAVWWIHLEARARDSVAAEKDTGAAREQALANLAFIEKKMREFCATSTVWSQLKWSVRLIAEPDRETVALVHFDAACKRVAAQFHAICALKRLLYQECRRGKMTYNITWMRYKE